MEKAHKTIQTSPVLGTNALVDALKRQHESLVQLRELLKQMAENQELMMSTMQAAQDIVMEALFDPDLD